MRTKRRINHLKNQIKRARKLGDYDALERFTEELYQIRRQVKQERIEFKKLKRMVCWH